MLQQKMAFLSSFISDCKKSFLAINLVFAYFIHHTRFYVLRYMISQQTDIISYPMVYHVIQKVTYPKQAVSPEAKLREDTAC